MAKRRRFSEEGFGETVQRLMDEQGVTYRQLADAAPGSRPAISTTSCTETVPCRRTTSWRRSPGALDVEPEHFREYRLRVITERLEAMPS